MFLVRNIFHTKPGKAKELVATFKEAEKHLEKTKIASSTRILTDSVAGFWTVVLEHEVEDLNSYANMAKTVSTNKEFGQAMKGYMDLVKSGHREVFMIE